LASLGKLLLTIAFFLSLIGGGLIGYAKVVTQEPRPAIGEKKFVIGQGGFPISYFQSGAKQGPAVVLLASLGRSISDFNELVEGLNKTGVQTIAVEAPGISDSGGDSWNSDLDLAHLAKDINNVVTASVGRDRPLFLIGHDFGAQLAQSFATRFNDKTAGLVLLAPTQGLPKPPHLRQAIMQIFLSILPENKRRDAVHRAYFARDNNIPGHWMGGWGLKTALLQKRALELAENSLMNVNLDLPTLLIQGDSDALSPLSEILALKKRLGKRATLVTLGRAGHALLPERPDEVLQEVKAFLTSLKQ